MIEQEINVTCLLNNQRKNNDKNSYYILVTEWLYPTESGRDTYEHTFDDKDEAIKESIKLCKNEMDVFKTVCEIDECHITCFNDIFKFNAKTHNVTSTCLNSFKTKYWFYVKVIELHHGRLL